MTRKDVALIASIIRRMPTHAATLRANQASVARQFALELKVQNERFDEAAFLTACGVAP